MSERGVIYLILAALVLTFAPCAAADEAQRSDWREKFATRGNDESRWKLAWNEMLASPDPETELRETLRYIFESRGLLEQEEFTEEGKRAVLTWLIVRVLDRKPTEPPVLAHLILERVYDDLELVRAVKKKLTLDRDDEQPGWQSLRDYAEEVLDAKQSTDETRKQSIWLLSTEANGRSAESVAILLPYARKWIGAPGKLREDVFLDAFERLLLRRFGDVKAAVGWLSTGPQKAILDAAKERRKARAIDRWRSYFNLLREGTKLRGKHAARMITYAKRHIDTITDPEGLFEYLTLKDTPEVEIRAYAIGRAATIGPDAKSKAWVDLVNHVLGGEPEPAVIGGLFDILRGQSFQKREDGDYSDDLVQGILERFRWKAATDRPEHRKQLVTTLMALGTSTNIEAALDDVQTLVLEDQIEGQLESYVLLLRRYGALDGARAAVIAKHYAGNEGKPAPTDVRRTAAEALGQSQIRKRDAGPAAALLRYLLMGSSGEGMPVGSLLPEGTPQEAEASVRAALLSSLQHYPERETFDLLLAVARGKDVKEAEFAVQTLGRILQRQKDAEIDAADALARLFVATDAPAEPVLVRALAELEKAPEKARPKALETVLAVLAPEGDAKWSEPVVQRAAGAATALRDGRAPVLAALVARRLAAGSDDVAAWTTLLQTHFAALAEAQDEALDRNIDQLLQTMSAAPKLDLAVELTAHIAEKAPRARTWFWKGRQLRWRAGAETATKEARAKDLETAITAYTEATKRGVEGEESWVRTAYDALYETAMERAKDADDSVVWWLTALDAAAESGSTDLGKRAQEAGGAYTLLTGEGLQLTEEQTQRRDAAKRRLDDPAGSR
ncbi:MAG: hypothetical protein QNJ98_17360 [Planctomycetota bacterium]|nr:hypothetical protein [Planctomycetota bacterium]